MRRAGILLFALLAGPAQAAWQWDAPLEVSSAVGPAIFPHVESANRQGLAVSGGTVGVVWEDNRSGAPRCYAAHRPAAAVLRRTGLPPGSTRAQTAPSSSQAARKRPAPPSAAIVGS